MLTVMLRNSSYSCGPLYNAHSRTQHACTHARSTHARSTHAHTHAARTHTHAVRTHTHTHTHTHYVVCISIGNIRTCRHTRQTYTNTYTQATHILTHLHTRYHTCTHVPYSYTDVLHKPTSLSSTAPDNVPLQVWPSVVCEVLHQSKQEDRDTEHHEQACNKPQRHMDPRIGLFQLPYKDGQHHQENQNVQHHDGYLQDQSPVLPAPPL